MSDDDDFMIDSADEEDFDFEYEDDAEEEDQSTEVGLENKYYKAKDLKEDDLDEAYQEFQQLIEADTAKSEWGLKALKQSIKILVKQENRTEAAELYSKFLDYLSTGEVSRNYAEKSLNTTLEHISWSDTQYMERIYAQTLKSLEGSNDRVWIRIAIKMATAYIDREMVDDARKVLDQLLQKCQGSDSTRATYLVEVYALQIQLYTLVNDNDRLEELYKKTLSIKTAIPHPRILGVVRECGGKMYMRQHQWDAAREDFFESFKNYDEAGSLQRVTVLKYYVLACMLSESTVNPFASQETKPYMNNPQINTMVQLVEAFQRSDIESFNALMKAHGAELMGDKFMRLFLDDVVSSIRAQGLLELVKPYTRVSIDFIASGLSISEPQVRTIVSDLILDGRLQAARLNSVGNYLEFNPAFTIPKWAPEVSSESTIPLPSRYLDLDSDTTESSSSRVDALHTLVSAVNGLATADA